MQKRDSFQAWCDGREGIAENFYLEIGEHWYSGSEIAGHIYYFWPYNNGKKKGLVFYCLDDKSSMLLDIISDYSEARFNTLSKYCPCTTQSMRDGMEPRLDRGALAKIDGNWNFVQSIDFNFSTKVEELGYNFMYDPIIADTALNLFGRLLSILEELFNFKGFNNIDEAKILMKELSPGIRISTKIIKALTGLVD